MIIRCNKVKVYKRKTNTRSFQLESASELNSQHVVLPQYLQYCVVTTIKKKGNACTNIYMRMLPFSRQLQTMRSRDSNNKKIIFI